MKGLLFIACLCYASIVYGQNIKGKVVDEQQRPLPYVSCVLLTTDSVFAAGTVSRTDGRFELPAEDAESYLVQCSCLGYETCTVGCQAGDPGTIALKKDAH